MQRSTREHIEGVKQFLRQMGSVQPMSVEEARSQQAAALASLPRLTETIVHPVHAAGMRAEWVSTPNVSANEPGVVLYMHGGAFMTGTCDTHRDLAARIAQASGKRVLVFEYRLAPEHLFPAANEDCIAAYRWLLQEGVQPENIVFGGESVGGYLALATLLSLRDAGEPLPAAAFLLSPHTDFIHYDSETYESNVEADPLGSRDTSRQCAKLYTGQEVSVDPLLYPVGAELKGLPPLLVHAGGDEVLLGECQRLVQRAQAAGVDAEIEVWEHMWCAFQLMAGIMPEGVESIEQIGQFVQHHLCIGGESST
ncbi:alpha/beta hydrolase [Paenibacillus sp. PR3]|uniref:Alpha/beta hydrolase n=1 Tax=Paenibacillus terricola TaxID=2763503 RepID=A0ABR8MSW3_9BACL|nr:alpha/beta hydrolase [Paenibacillus terricola]MBD3917925.1 alpha/beta hydrolase [Paenibacillus terricola]